MGFQKSNYLFKLYKLNQGFTTFDFLTLIGSLVIVGAVSIPIVQKNLQSSNIEQAQFETKKWAGELLYSKDSSLLRQVTAVDKAKNRNIASVVGKPAVDCDGQVGKDPWGQPYQFKFVRNDQGMPIEIKVWSDGPDQAHTEVIEARATLR
jgi:hypothetical protein